MSKWDDTLEPPVEGFQALKTRIQNRETQRRQLKLTLLAVAFVVGLILLNGFVWIVGLSWFSLQKKVLVTSLRVE